MDWDTCQAAADAQTPRHRDVVQPAEDRLATLLSFSELTTCLANYSITKKIVLELSSCFYAMTETTVLDFKLSNTFEEFRTHMNAPEQQAMFAQMGVKTFYIGVSKDDPGRATVMFQGPENVLYDIFVNPETKPIVEASGHIYDGTVITRWLA